ASETTTGPAMTSFETHFSGAAAAVVPYAVTAAAAASVHTAMNLRMMRGTDCKRSAQRERSLFVRTLAQLSAPRGGGAAQTRLASARVRSYPSRATRSRCTVRARDGGVALSSRRMTMKLRFAAVLVVGLIGCSGNDGEIEVEAASSALTDQGNDALFTVKLVEAREGSYELAGVHVKVTP